MTTCTLELVAAALGCGKDAAKKRAARERWPYTEQTCRGGRRRIYDVASLPDDIRARVLLHVSSAGRQQPASSPDGKTPSGDVFSAAPEGGTDGHDSLPLAARAVAILHHSRQKTQNGRVGHPDWAGTPGQHRADGQRPADGAGALSRGVVGDRPRARGTDAAADALPAGGRVGRAGLGVDEAGRAACGRGASRVPAPLTEESREALWRWYDSRPQAIKDEASRRLPAVQAVRRLLDSGLRARRAIAETARVMGVPAPTLRRWWYGEGTRPGCHHAHPSDYLPLLAPRWAGSAEQAEIDPAAWDALLADYLRPEQPALRACYRRLLDAAKQHGWAVPSYATVARRIESLPWQAVVLAREGEEALKRRLHHVTRTKGHLHALEAVNADGHVFDLRVQLPSGEVGRPVLVAWQDIYSGKILAWRCGETLSSHMVRLAFGDVVERYGVPEHAYLDNGREFAAKALTGGARTRFRFAIRDDDPVGLFTQLGVTVHWTTPYHGQAKPIERAFRDLCEGIARHPAAAGAYTGNSPLAKPANYGARALSWDEFVRLVDAGIAEHNARPDRRSGTARGRSFDAAFAESYARAVIRRPTDEQRRLWLLAAEGVQVRATGHVAIAGNAYWGEHVAALAGQKVLVRFDPDRLDQPVHVYTLAGAYVGAAERTVAAFDDAEAARAHARAHRQALRAARQMRDALARKESLAAVARLPQPLPDTEPPQPAAVRIMPAPRIQRAEALQATGTDDYVSAADRLVMAALEIRRRPAQTID